jgi:hypothetical protein
MNGGNKMGMKLAAIMAAVLFTVTISFSWYYKNTQEKIGLLRENAAKLETAVRANEEALEQTQADAVRNAELSLELQIQLQKSEQYADELRATLQKHDLTMLALRKPGLIEQRMNDATRELFDNIVADTTD